MILAPPDFQTFRRPFLKRLFLVSAIESLRGYLYLIKEFQLIDLVILTTMHFWGNALASQLNHIGNFFYVKKSC